MDEKMITRSAEAAIADLELDCGIEGVRHLSGDVGWCVEFSGKYGPLRDNFKNQFDKENSAKVIREKIKRHLLEQVTKIRSNTGKRKRPRAVLNKNRDESRVTDKAYEFIDDAFDRASRLAGRVAERVSGAAAAARDAVSDIAENLTPITVEVHSVAPSTKTRTARATKPKAPAARKPTTKAAAKGPRAGKSVSKSGKGKRAAKKGKEIARRR